MALYEKLGSPSRFAIATTTAYRRVFVTLLACGFILYMSFQVLAPRATTYIDQYVHQGNVNILRQDDLHEPQANSTLGFQKIFYLNLPYRYDLDDAVVLQASVSEIDVEKVDAIIASDLNPKGMPPSSNNMEGAGAKSCYRSHSNIWRTVLRENIETALIIEADAVWDINIRKQLGYFSAGFQKLLLQMDRIPKTGEVAPTPEDPYMSPHWEILQLGGCFENRAHVNVSQRYRDPYAQPSTRNYYDGEPYGEDTRVARWQNDMMCTTGYAITKAGARKLLLRAAIDMNTPVDGLIAELVREQKINAFSVSPYLFAQWEYRDSLGVAEKNSDISNFKSNELDKEQRRKAWAEARKDMSVWGYNVLYREARFKSSALHKLRGHLYGHDEL